MQLVTSTELQRKLGKIMSKAKREPVVITTRGREELILCDAEEYKRLKELDTRRAFFPHELSDEWKDELNAGFQGEDTPELDENSS